LQPEQEGNIDFVARFGSAIRLRKSRLSRASLLEALEGIAGDGLAHQRAAELRQIFAGWDGTALVAEFLREKFL